ncbi:acyltransferase [Rivibacter subsaxonicus]|uniref:Putative LPLAT superfamily acyltransferase n=1 Tax=Rivibacter subsaxonicus TaxID=457575 RepID=A0A4Q7W1B5_9BURK|nr:acyltransferase [Rivibacter subsaxonicus]RZU03007.1 putative LPLAT superfamily acyltransferase [Rivibacter subsaxonicus]
MSKQAHRHWSSIGEHTSVAGIWLLWAVYRVFGRTPFRLCLYPVVTWYWATRADARRASLQYLQRIEAAHGAFGGPPGWRQSLLHFLAFAETLLDKLLAASGRYGFGRVRVEGREDIALRLARGEGALIVTAHVGCLEMCQALAEQDVALPLTVLVHTRHAERFNAVLRRLNPKQRIELLQVTEVDAATAARLAARVEAGGVVAIVGDRVPVRQSKTLSLPFLGHAAPFPVGAYVLAALLKCPLYFMGCIREADGRHVQVFELLAERVVLPRTTREAALREHAARYVAALERLLVRAPCEWFNFFAFWDQPTHSLPAGPEHPATNLS